jgi:hypothetical protein
LDPNQTDIQAIKEFLENKSSLQYNPFQVISKQAIERALEVLEEYSEEITFKNEPRK